MSNASPISPATPRRSPRAQATTATADVLLVHGIWNTAHWLLPLARRMRADGLAPALFGYASVLGGPAQAVPRLIERLRASRAQWVVCHSLGGLMTLQALKDAPDLPVALAETRLPGLRDHCVVRASHSGLLRSPEAAAQALAFLRTGRFQS
ncbi:hypothetical protein FQJ95_16330 [Xanthomonas vasicola]|nr:hypothetical protein FQJ95_16330 [Xanthomonas vasicola]